MNTEPINAAIAELEADINDMMQGILDLQQCVNGLLRATGQAERYSPLDGSRLAPAREPEPVRMVARERAKGDKRKGEAERQLSPTSKEKPVANGKVPSDCARATAVMVTLGEFNTQSLKDACPADLQKRDYKFFSNVITQAKSRGDIVSAGAHGCYRLKSLRTATKPERENTQMAPRVGEKKSPPPVASFAPFPAGRLPYIEGENVIDGIRRALPLMPKTFCKPELMARLPLHMTSGTYEKLIGQNMTELRQAGELAFDETKRSDGLQGYQHGKVKP